MTLATSPIFGMLNTKMNWLTQRQRVVAQNIANADTPTYRAQDLKALDFKRELSGARIKFRLAQTSEAHISSPHAGDYRFSTQRSRRSYETAPMKNNVVLEEQMMKMATTQADYQMATTVYRQYSKLYNISLGRSGGG
ncbi:MAG: flagellar basal body rod protein FlgB [Alphaproteobacteria bacterium]